MTGAMRVAADIGGTFTDIAVIDADGSVVSRKVSSTPEDFARGVLDGLRALLGDLQAQPRDVAEVLHGCTVASNVILEEKGAATALLTTRGFRDVLELRRIRVPSLYDPMYVKPRPLVEREWRFEVDERIGADGTIVRPLIEADVEAAATAIAEAEIEAVAVTFLHSYRVPDHEQRAGDILRQRLPGRFITLSTEVLPEVREYERTSTTVINAYVGPPVRRYLRSLIAQLEAAGIPGQLRVMQSSGGILDAAAVMERPAQIVEGGPAAGVIGAARVARMAGLANVITLDMGGTTAKASIIEDGEIVRTGEYEVGGGISLSSRLVKGGGYALKLPVIDISEVGAGGGSIVWLDKGGAIKVGPQSAGADPGPACYARGGEDATVTDANLVLGFLNAEALAGGTVPLQAERAHAAIRARVAAPLGLSVEDAARGIHAIAVANMMRAVKAVSTYRGRDPRDFVLMAFGGNGGIHAAEMARELEIAKVLVPPAAGVFSALGLLLSDIELTASQAYLQLLDAIDVDDMEACFRALERRVVRDLSYPADAVRFQRLADLRFAGQAFELTVPLPEGALDATALTALGRAFEAEHERTYGHRFGGNDPVETVTLRVTGRATPQGRRAIDAARALQQWRGGASREGRRRVYFGRDVGWMDTPILARAHLLDGERSGPLVIEDEDATTVVPPDCRATLDALGNIVIAVPRLPRGEG